MSESVKQRAKKNKDKVQVIRELMPEEMKSIKPEIVPMGRPSLYKQEYCEMLIKHMSNGDSFQSFAGDIDVSPDTLQEWLAVHPEFSVAKKKGLAKSRKFWEGIAKAQAAGQLKRIKSETPVLAKNEATGKMEPVYDKQGNIVMRREYEFAQGAQATLIFMLKNMHGYRDRHQLEHSLVPPTKDEFEGMTDEELEAEAQRLIKRIP